MNDTYWEISHKCGGQHSILSWLKQISPPVGCKCGHLENPRELDVVLQSDLDCSFLYACLFDSLGFEVGGVIPVVDSRLIDLVGVASFNAGFCLGAVDFVEPNNQWSFVSLVPQSNKSVVRIRSDSNVRISLCKKCKASLLFDEHYLSPNYVLENDVYDRLPVYPGLGASLLVRDDVMSNISCFSDTLHINKIPIVEKPLDGLPENLLTLPRNVNEIIRLCPDWKGHLLTDIPSPETAPCPYCGASLRTRIAKYCRQCKMDWRDPENIFKRS